MDMNRRHFFQVSSAGLVGSSLAALGFSPTEALAQTRNFKLSRTTETRNTCPYCSVGCGIIMYSLGCLLYTSPSPRDKRQSRMPSSA